jgi:hypothetical protein
MNKFMFCRLKKMDKKSLGHVTRRMLPDDDWKLPFSLFSSVRPEPFSADHSTPLQRKGEKGKKLSKLGDRSGPLLGHIDVIN